MATITAAAIVWSTAAGNKTTASFTPVANELLVCFSLHTAVDAASTITDTDGGTWVQVGSLFSHSTTVAGTIGFYVRTTGVSGAAMTVTSAPGGTSTGGGLAVLRIAGSAGYGSGAIRSTGGQADQAANGTPAPVLASTPQRTDSVVSCVVDNTNGTANAVPRTGYTEFWDLGFNTPATGIEVNGRNESETSATITYGGTTPSEFGSFAASVIAADTPMTAIGTSELATAVPVRAVSVVASGLSPGRTQ